MEKGLRKFWTMIWTVVRVWLGYEWLTAGLHKLGGFDAGGFLQGTLAKAGGENAVVTDWYAAFVEHFAIPNVGVFNVLIPIGELLIGIGLILGALTIPALVAGAFMNLNFLLAGTISTNPILLVIAFLLLLVGHSAYRIGVDYYLLPLIKKIKYEGKMMTLTKHT